MEQLEQTVLVRPNYSCLVLSKTKRRIDSKGYFNIRKDGKYFKEHRIIWEKYYGACLLGWSHIHHKNGNRKDNRISNLKAMTKQQHSRLHMIGNKLGIGKGYHWKQDDPRRIFTDEHKKNIGLALKGKKKSKTHRSNIKKHHWRLKAYRY